MSSAALFRPVTLLLPIVYVVALYAAVHYGDFMLLMSYDESWQQMPDAAAKLRGMLYLYPIVSIPLSVMSLAVLAQLATRQVTKLTIFIDGLMACSMGNLMAFQGLKMLVGWDLASEWSRHLDSYRLNVLTTFVAPISAFLITYLAAIVLTVIGVNQWLKPE